MITSATYIASALVGAPLTTDLALQGLLIAAFSAYAVLLGWQMCAQSTPAAATASCIFSPDPRCRAFVSLTLPLFACQTRALEVASYQRALPPAADTQGVGGGGSR